MVMMMRQADGAVIMRSLRI